MSTANINVRVDVGLKKDAEALFADLGLNMTSAITLFLRSAVSHEGIPFPVCRLTPNEETKQALAEYQEMHDNPEKYKRYRSFAEMVKEMEDDA